MAKALVPVLVVLLLGTNVAWWLARQPDAPVVPPEPAAPAEHAVDQAAQQEQLAALERDLAAALARIVELESPTVRTPAPPQRSEADIAREAAAAERRERAERMRKVHETQAGWVEAALQTADIGKRNAAIAALRDALSSGDPDEVLAALGALARLRELDYDKESFRALVLPCLRSEDGATRAAALYALFNTAPHDGDLAAILAMGTDPSPEVRRSLTHAIVLFGKRKVEGASADVVLQLLDDQDEQVRRHARSSLAHAHVDERVEQHFLTLAEDPRHRHDAVYFGLSTFSPKSPRVVAALLRALEDPNSEISGRAAWGLGSGVGAESKDAVADAFLRLLTSRSDPRVIEDSLHMLEAHGSARHVPDLEVFLARPSLSEALRRQVEQLCGRLRSR